MCNMKIKTRWGNFDYFTWNTLCLLLAMPTNFTYSLFFIWFDFKVFTPIDLPVEEREKQLDSITIKNIIFVEDKFLSQ